MVQPISVHSIMKAARALVVEILENNLKSPYRGERRGPSFYLYGPQHEINWLTGEPVAEWEDQLTCITFSSNFCTVYIYEDFQDALGFADMYAHFEYANPDFPEQILTLINKLISHHAVLIKSTKDEHNDFLLAKAKMGVTPESISLKDIPLGRYPNYGWDRDSTGN